MNDSNGIKEPYLVLMTFLSGYINILAIWNFGVGASHFSGNISKMAMALTQGLYRELIILTLCMGLFFLGSLIMGYLSFKNIENFNHIYIVILVVQGIILVPFVKVLPQFKLLLLALYMGIQNGSVVFYNGIKIRHTHMTGYLTDSAHEIAYVAAGNKSTNRLWFFVRNILAFNLGGILGSVLFLYNYNYSIIAASLLYFLSAASLSATVTAELDLEQTDVEELKETP